MSNEEQDAIVGRTLREHLEQKRKLAILQVKASDYAHELRAVAADLTAGTISSVSRIEHLPSRMDILAVLGEIRDTKERIDELGESLRIMNS